MIKLIGTAYKRDDFTHEEFFRYWNEVHAPISAKAPGLRGYVVSEVIRKVGGELQADAFVEQWFDSMEAYEAASQSPEVAAAWADVANYAKTTGTFWVVKEHVLIPPPIEGPGILQRKSSDGGE
jgi:uncharacterized protein (TIGR02118 family)